MAKTVFSFRSGPTTMTPASFAAGTIRAASSQTRETSSVGSPPAGMRIVRTSCSTVDHAVSSSTTSAKVSVSPTEV